MSFMWVRFFFSILLAMVAFGFIYTVGVYVVAILPYVFAVLILSLPVCLVVGLWDNARKKRRQAELDEEFERKWKERDEYYEGLHQARLDSIRQRVEQRNTQEAQGAPAPTGNMFEFVPID